MKIFIIVLFTLICLGAAGWVFKNSISATVVFEAARDSDVGKVETKPQQDNIFFVGDIMLARDVERRLKDQPVTYAFEELPMLQKAEFVVGNFEAAIPKEHQPTPNLAMRFSVAPSLLEILKSGGVTHLSLANNHSLDYFADGYSNTLNELGSRGFKTFGHPTKVDRGAISYLEAGGQTFALIGINATYGEIPATWADILQEASEQSDKQIVYIHWGEEYELVHNESQEVLARSFIDAGVDIVIGHHPHVVQDIERYKDGIIFYSLGNFIFDQYWNKEVSEGLMLELAVEAQNLNIILNPVESRTTKVKPRLMVDSERTMFLEDLAKRSSPSLADEIKSGSLTLQF